MFTKESGIEVEYKEVIQNNAPFYARIEPSLQEGESIGFDIIVLTNGWYLTQLINNGWLVQLDHSKLPNFSENAGASVQDPFYDPGNQYTLPWQSGMTGIGYDPRKTGREITSVQDLFDPAFEGHVGMMSDNTELGSVALLANEVNPGDSTPEDWRAAAELLEKQREDGIVRQYYDQGYIKALRQGDVWLTQAWSGDIFQSQNSGFPHLEFVVPEEGAMFWTDNMMIPLGAEHPADALEWMNFYYRPDIAAIVADWVWYICPVPAAKQIIAEELDDPTVANSPLIFPTPEMEGQLRPYPVYENFEEFDEWNSTFDPIIQA
jgi:spermidine/putrescine transport system substrate-binding protein